MGGPSKESYLAAQRREQARWDALRTRDGLVDLAEWRAALHTVPGLEKLLGNPPWLEHVRLAPASEVGFELLVTMLWYAHEGHMCLPSSVDEVPVRVIVRNPGVKQVGSS